MKKTTLLLIAIFFAPFFTFAQNSTSTKNQKEQIIQNAGDNRLDSGGGFMSSGAERFMKFSTDKSVLLKQVDINANQTGEMVVQLQDETGIILDTKAITLVKSGIQNIDLDFIVPAGRNFKLIATKFSKDLKLYRNNLSVSYPYSNGPIDIIDSSSGYAFYYFFYNWKVEKHSIITDSNSITSL